MTVNLTPHAEMLLQQLTRAGSPEQAVETALERMAAERTIAARQMTPHEAVERIRALRIGVNLGDVPINELINEGREY